MSIVENHPASVADASASNRPLFGLTAITGACVFAGLMPSALMIACNYAALGSRRMARVIGIAAIVLICLSNAALIVLLFLMSTEYPDAAKLVFAVFLLVQPLVALAWALSAQGQAIKARSAAGLPMRSGWHAVIIVLATWLLHLLVYAALVAVLMVFFYFSLGRG